MAIGASGGAFAGLVNQGAGFLRDMLTNKWTTEQEAETRRHEAALRRDAAHSEARAYHVARARQFRSWVLNEWAAEYGLDADFINPFGGRPAETDRDMAVSALRDIAEAHPTKVVRELASEMYASVEGAVNHAEYQQGMTGHDQGISEDRFRQWAKKSAELLELIHDPT